MKGKIQVKDMVKDYSIRIFFLVRSLGIETVSALKKCKSH